jgi:glycosyltransferase involved in cell wall biosynthesis
MGRGVDATLFDPAKRDRSPGPFMLGSVGRLTVEKNVRLLVELEKALLELGCKNFRFFIVGQGVLEPWLRENLHHGAFAGVL